jgi:hypothetical protein
MLEIARLRPNGLGRAFLFLARRDATMQTVTIFSIRACAPESVKAKSMSMDIVIDALKRFDAFWGIVLLIGVPLCIYEIRHAPVMED